jgi:hypothetical protein
MTMTSSQLTYVTRYFLLSTTMLFGKDWNPDGLVSSKLAYSEGFSYSYLQHCYVTGGSTGLGLELAKLLTQKGAHVSIVARNQERLDAALSQLEVYFSSINSAYVTIIFTQMHRQRASLPGSNYTLTPSPSTRPSIPLQRLLLHVSRTMEMRLTRFSLAPGLRTPCTSWR